MLFNKQALKRKAIVLFKFLAYLGDRMHGLV